MVRLELLSATLHCRLFATSGRKHVHRVDVTRKRSRVARIEAHSLGRCYNVHPVSENRFLF